MASFIRADPKAHTLHIDPAKMLIRSVITTIEPDRAGDVVIPTGLRNADDYLLNPVVLWAHNRSSVPPIGTCEWLDIQPSRIVAQTKFAQNVPFAEDVFKLYEQQILKGWSIGFVPRKSYRRAATEGRIGLRIEEWELFEYSAVPIPENPGTLTAALQKGMITNAALYEWLRTIPDDPGGKFWRTQPTDVFSDLVC
jgi:hypothetical protein